jgi:hypothetical protein
MQAPSRDAHVLWPGGGIQPVKHSFDSRPPCGRHAPG